MTLMIRIKNKLTPEQQEQLNGFKNQMRQRQEEQWRQKMMQQQKQQRPW